MRFIKILAIVPLLTGCVKDYSEFQFNSKEIEIAAAHVLSSHEVNTIVYGTQLSNIPKEIAELNPESVYLTELGLYIQLDSFFVEESGLFIPIKSMDSLELEGSDPRYTRLSGNVFSYITSG
ncbi:hypothetical protein [Alteromonas gracilis]|uniref:hypothetical protein n=1 Tax=Alteromonas gracilis TaxID=1479524 RepID=UPI0037357F99